MRVARIQTNDGTWLAALDAHGTATPLLADNDEPWFDPLRAYLFNQQVAQTDANAIAANEYRLLAPVRSPQKVIAVGLNYKDHAAEQNKPLPTAPMLFNKSPGAIIGTTDTIAFAASDSDNVDYEGELAIVIGARASKVAESSALAYVFGYTICNDVSARDAQRDDIQFFRAKSFDTFCPLGPWIVTKDDIPDPQNLAVRTWVNGELRQNGTTAEMIFSVAEIISYTSRYLTLEPGDIITTGTPAGVGSGFDVPVFLKDGDTVEVEIENIGRLQNPISRS